MNNLEKAILSELMNSDNANDMISNAAKKYGRPPERKTNIFRRIFAAAAFLSGTYGTYCLCQLLAKEKDQMTLAIPTAIIGICGANYTRKKISNKL